MKTLLVLVFCLLVVDHGKEMSNITDEQYLRIPDEQYLRIPDEQYLRIPDEQYLLSSH